MSIRDRDKKILMAVIPLAVLLGFWFMILAPKRSEAGRLGKQLTAVQAKRDTAVTQAGHLEGARNSYAKDYETVVRLGKAVPASLDMPSLLVQLDSAAKGTNIKFDSVKAGVRTTTPTASSSTSTSTSTSTSSSSKSGSSASQPPAAAGGAPAQTGPGKTVEKAGDATATANKSTAASTSASTGSSASGSTSSSAPAAGGASAAGLDSVPLEFAFTGDYFDLADFFHEMKRFVRLSNDKIKVQGRLITIDSLDFTSDNFPHLSASVKATVYLSPESQGTTAGATAAGPQTTSASASAGSSSATSPSSSTSSAPPSGSSPAPTGGAPQ